MFIASPDWWASMPHVIITPIRVDFWHRKNGKAEFLEICMALTAIGNWRDRF
jgi:hypothetical protein